MHSEFQSRCCWFCKPFNVLSVNACSTTSKFQTSGQTVNLVAFARKVSGFDSSRRELTPTWQSSNSRGSLPETVCICRSANENERKLLHWHMY